jgi:hypothetical protein
MAIAVMPPEPKDRWTKGDYLLAAAVTVVLGLFVVGIVLAYVFE